MVATNDVANYHYGDVVSRAEDHAKKMRALAEIDASGVRPGQRYQHWKGTFYTVTSVGLFETTLDAIVGYAGPDGITWYRTLHVWCEEVEEGVPRYRLVPVDDAPAPRRCSFSEGSCKAADCPEHGIFPPRESAHPMMPRGRGGRYL